MKIKWIISSLLILSFLTTGVSGVTNDYYPGLIPEPGDNVILTWNIVEAPETPFSLFFSGQGAWIAEIGSKMNFSINEVDGFLEGELQLGNISIVSNDTDIAKDLVLGVGVFGERAWLPGFVVEIGQDNFDSLNETAYASASRVAGNYMNGTMTSSYEQMTVSGVIYESIQFEYAQDDSGFGEPQRTQLAYDMNTGILIWANTSFRFDVPYHLEFELQSYSIPVDGIPTTIAFLVAGSIIVVLVGVYIVKKR
ncbi:MAG: hypothetical protein ACW99V_04845 [Candidatus Thorarchaeota archaeon]|jgi:hypothetical protein